MATPTQTPDRLDPDEQEYEQNFDFGRQQRARGENQRVLEDGRDKGGAAAAAGSWSRDKRSVSEREAAPSWDTNLGGQSGGGGKGKGNVATQMAKNRIKQWVIGGLATFIFGAAVSMSAGVTGLIGNLTDMMSNWGNKNNNSLFSKRTAKFMEKKLFNADKDSKDTVKDRYKRGISQKEIDKMKKQGLNPKVAKAGDRQYITSFDTVDDKGKKVTVTAANFTDNYRNNPAFRAKMDGIAKPNAMFMRGQQTLSKVFNKFGIQRNMKIEGADDKEKTKSFRQTAYGTTNEPGNIAATDGADEAATSAMGDAEESLKQAIDAERVNLSKDDFANPPSIVPDVTDLDLDEGMSEGVTNNILRDQLGNGSALRNGVQGAFSIISNVCGSYQILRTVEFGAKVWKAIALIKYIGIFMVILQKVQAGDGSVGEEIAFLLAILNTPSNKKDSKGKTFWQSEGFNLMFQNKVADHRGLARFTTGTAFMKFIQGAKQYLENMGANKTTCKHVNSWYGQALLTIGGLAVNIFTGGSFSVAGVVGGFAIGMLVSVLIAYATPFLIQYAVGSVAPDPTDAEGGYGAGNAMAAGMGAFGNFAGRANGARILSSGEAATIEMQSNKEMAFQAKVDNLGKNPFSLDSNTSIPSKLAFAAMPYISAPLSSSSFQSLASVVMSPLSLFSNSFSNIMTQGVNAQADIDKGGEFCADEEYRNMQVAVDALCNPIPGEEDSVISDPKYAPDKVLEWMLANGHIEDDEEGTPKSDDYKKYLRSCVDGTAPISPDGGGLDVGEDIDTRWCMDPAEKFTMFRFFIADGAIEVAHEASVNDELGLDKSGGTPAGSAGADAMTAEECKTANNRGDQLACNAQLFTPYYYLWAGGHGSIDQIKKYINDAKNGDNKGAAILDCSGFVRTVYYMTMGVDVGAGTANSQAHSSHFKPINDADAKPGDIIWHSSPYDHIAIVTANNPETKTFSLIHAPRTGKPIAKTTAKYSEYQAFTYTGN